jgi:2,3-bisphosphoglycerate-independent phosphoglycerate mutase
VGRIRDGAAVVLFNFRGDRAVEITRALTEDATFSGLPARAARPTCSSRA